MGESIAEAGSNAVTNAANSVTTKVTDAGKQAAGGVVSWICSLPGKLIGGVGNVLGAAFNGLLYVGAPLAAICAWVPQLPSTVIGFVSKDAANKFNNMDVKDRVLAGLSVGAGTSAGGELVKTVFPMLGGGILGGLTTVAMVAGTSRVAIGAFGKDNGGSDPVRPTVPTVTANTSAQAHV